MISLIVGFGMAIWFFQTAKKVEEDPWMWGVIGAICYFAVVKIANFSLIKVSNMIQVGGGSTGFSNFLIVAASIALAVLVTVFVRARYLLPK